MQTIGLWILARCATTLLLRMQLPKEPSPLQKLECELYSRKQVQVFMKRDDLLHPHIQGNKWRKLKYNLQAAKQNGHNQLLTFGGYYSNHIYATAAAAKLYGFEAVGIIRGEKPTELSATLQFAIAEGMKLKFVSREQYAHKYEVAFLDTLREEFSDFYLLPEGGTNDLALKGVAETIAETGRNFNAICVACGTGGTLAGIVAGMNGESQIIGFSSLKGEDLLTETVHQLTKEYTGNTYSNFTINRDFQFGGYAKSNKELMKYVQQFKQAHGILLDPVYTSKMMYGVDALIAQNYFGANTKILCIHTGGLQGWSGFKNNDSSNYPFLTPHV